MSRALLAAVTLVAGLAAAPAFAAEDAPEISTALLNVAKVFKNATRFIERMAVMKAKIDAYDAAIRLRGDRLKEAAELVKRAMRETPETAKALEVQWKKDSAELQAEMEQMKREFLQEEAEIYSKTYNAMRDEVAKICKARKIRLVLRSNSGDPEDHTNREEILQRVNRAVVFEDNLDITDDVIKALNAREKAPAEPAQAEAR